MVSRTRGGIPGKAPDPAGLAQAGPAGVGQKARGRRRGAEDEGQKAWGNWRGQRAWAAGMGSGHGAGTHGGDGGLSDCGKVRKMRTLRWVPGAALVVCPTAERCARCAPCDRHPRRRWWPVRLRKVHKMRTLRQATGAALAVRPALNDPASRNSRQPQPLPAATPSGLPPPSSLGPTPSARPAPSGLGPPLLSPARPGPGR